ncbi:MAG: BlaI/MecI/CopY family transcriptional regulator [Pirellulales bacterium]
MAEPLPDAELEIMACLWQSGPLTARQLREKLKAYRPLAHASVCTLLNRLEAKNFVGREKAPVGKAFVYSARVKPTQTYRRLLGSILDRVFAGSGVALVASLFETKAPSLEEIEELEALLRQLRSKNSGQATKPSKRGGRRK